VLGLVCFSVRNTNKLLTFFLFGKNSVPRPCDPGFYRSYAHRAYYTTGRMTYGGCVDPKLLAVALTYPIHLPKGERATCVTLPLPSESEPIMDSDVLVYCYRLKSDVDDRKTKQISRYVSASE